MTNAAQIPDLRLQISNRQILKIALPISFSIFVPQINFLTNTIFLGGLGNDSLAAAGITGVYYLIFAVIGSGLNNGLQALISRRAGENKPEEIGKLFAQGVRISLAIAAFGILVTYFAAPAILKWSLQSGLIHDKTVEFLRIRIWGLPFLYIYQMRNALLVGTNQSNYLMGGALAETAANIFFDYGFIYGKFGLPALGFNGAAYASIIAEFAGLIVVYLIIHVKGVGKRFSLFSHFRWDAVTSRLILTQSLPLIFQYAISIVTWQFFYILVEHHGSRALAISTTMRTIFGLFGIFTWAFAATCTTMVSNIIGQGFQDKVPGLIGKIAVISTGTGVFFWALLNIFPRLFLSVFGQGPEFVEEAIPVLRVVAFAVVLMSFASIWLNAVVGTGNSKVNLKIEVAAVVAYSIYVFVVLEWLKLSIIVGWMSDWLYWVILFSLSWWYIRSGKWRNKVI